MINLFNVTNVSNTIPVIGDLLNQMNFLINIFIAFGGIVIVFIIFTIYKFLTLRKELRLLKEINTDIKKLKKKLRVR